jgi:hypothetical protein
MTVFNPITQSETVRQPATIIKSSDANFSVIRSPMAGGGSPDIVVTTRCSENRNLFLEGTRTLCA